MGLFLPNGRYDQVNDEIRMDYLAHGLWSYLIFHRIKKIWAAVFFGVFPDTISWAIYLFYNIFTGQFTARAPQIQHIPGWVFALYGFSHSLCVALIILLICYISFRKFPYYILAWPLHITLDLFTHSRSFLPTPIFWPFSTWTFPGMRWSTWWFMILNYTAIFSYLGYLLWRKKYKPKIH